MSIVNRLHGDTWIDIKGGREKIKNLVGQKVICYDKNGKEIETTVRKEKSDKIFQYLFCSLNHYQYFTVLANRPTMWLKYNGLSGFGFTNDCMKVAGEFSGDQFILEHISFRPFFIPSETYSITRGTGTRGVRLSNGLIIIEEQPKVKKYWNDEAAKIIDTVNSLLAYI